MPAPEGGLDRILLIGCGKTNTADEADLLKIGGKIMATIGKAEKVTVMADASNMDEDFSPEAVAMIAGGCKLRGYRFDDYLTKGREADKKESKAKKVVFGTNNLATTKKVWTRVDGVTDGVLLARQLVNEPANVLGPIEFAKQAQKLKSLGVEVEVHDVPKMQ